MSTDDGLWNADFDQALRGQLLFRKSQALRHSAEGGIFGTPNPDVRSSLPLDAKPRI
jgi:hypothetical protein